MTSQTAQHPTETDVRRNAIWCLLATVVSIFAALALRFLFARWTGESMQSYFSALEPLKYLSANTPLLGLTFLLPWLVTSKLRAMSAADNDVKLAFEHLYLEQGKQYDSDSASRDRRMLILWLHRALVSVVFLVLLLVLFRIYIL